MATTSGWLANLLGITTVQDESVDVTARAKLNFTGAGVTVTSNAETDAIDVTIGGGGATDTTNSTLVQETVETSTTSTTPVTAGTTFTLADDSDTLIDVEATCIEQGAGKSKTWNIRREFLQAGGVFIAEPAQEDLAGPKELGGATAATISILRTGTTGRVELVGVAATNHRWRIDRQIKRITAEAGVAVPAPTDFTTIDLTGLWLAPYAGGGADWTGSASAGTSSGRLLEDLGVTGVGTGTTIDGVAPAAFTGTERLYGPGTNTLLGASAGTVIILAKPTAAPADVPAAVNLPGLFGTQSAGEIQMAFSDAGLRVSAYDSVASAYQEAPAIAAASGAYHVFAARYTGTQVQASVDGSAFASASTPCDVPARSAAPTYLGANNAALGASADVLALLTADYAMTDAELADVIGVLNILFPTATP